MIQIKSSPSNQDNHYCSNIGHVILKHVGLPKGVTKSLLPMQTRKSIVSWSLCFLSFDFRFRIIIKDPLFDQVTPVRVTMWVPLAIAFRLCIEDVRY